MSYLTAGILTSLVDILLIPVKLVEGLINILI